MGKNGEDCKNPCKVDCEEPRSIVLDHRILRGGEARIREFYIVQEVWHGGDEYEHDDVHVDHKIGLDW